MRKDRFSDEALRAAQALIDLKYSENEEDQLRFAEAYDFARCQRPDGTFYGTSGQCRKGKDAGAKPEEPKKARAPKAAAAAPAAPAASSGGMNLQKQVASDARAIINRRAFDTEKGTKAFNDAKKRLLARSEQLGEKPGKQNVKKMVEELRALEKQIGTVNYDRRRVSEILRALIVNDKEAAKEAGAGGGESKPKKLKTDFRKDVEKGAAKRKAASAGVKEAAAQMKANRAAYLGEKAAKVEAGPRAAQLKELKAAWKDREAVVKERKAELDRVDRAFKMQQKKVKEEPTKENKNRLKLVRTALINEERAYNRAEREAEKAAKAWQRLNKRNEREKMSPTQRKEAALIDRQIREMG